ncbi:MAG: class I SAM-dependent methyltransferase [Proteobacteria bacterium]|nr:class I SAM-dependent methyltransferase [Pseudomonadota bacterium]
MLSIPRRILKRFHPEGIPWPMSRVYNALSSMEIFQHHYELCARDVAAIQRTGRLLDVGTGPGWLLGHLAREAPGLELVGLDVSPAMVKQAGKNLGGQARMELGNAEDLPFEDGFFDVVVSTGSMHHWKDPVKGLDEIHRVLAPGGRALVYDLVTHTPREILKQAAGRFGRMRVILLWLHSFEEPFYSPADMAELAEKSAFRQGEASFVGVMCRLVMEKEA